MLRTALSAFGLLFASVALAQNYTGTFTTANSAGGVVTLKLKQDANNRVRGTLEGNGNRFDVEGQATPQGLMGTARGPSGSVYLMAELRGVELTVILAEPGPNGEPNLQAARQLVFAKSGAARRQAPRNASGSDSLAQLLTRNAWCGFTYNQRTGTSTTERVVFHGNGVVVQTTGRESYNSGPKSGGKEYMQCN